MKTIACIAGARPNFMKIAAVLRALRPHFTAPLIHTGQHNSPEMSQKFFDDLEIAPPDFHLEIGGKTHAQQTASVMCGLEPVLAGLNPRLVLVVGDVNSTLAAALVAAKLNIPIAHVEAGLRSFDRGMPEEVNRMVVDALSEYLFVSEPAGMDNLRAEGVPDGRIFFVGNVMIDTLRRFRPKANRSSVLTGLGLEPRSYAVATLHRPSNVDDATRLAELVAMLHELSATLPVVFPVHPRTRHRIGALPEVGNGSLRLTPPLGYLDFLHLLDCARLVLTDSGGIQEETTVLQVPCLTVRENTERPVTVQQGTNRLVGVQPGQILAACSEILASAPPCGARIPDLWDGRAAERIAGALRQHLEGSRETGGGVEEVKSQFSTRLRRTTKDENLAAASAQVSQS